MFRKIVAFATALMIWSAIAGAQDSTNDQSAQRPTAAQKADMQKGEPQKAEPARAPEGKPINIKIELAITDQTAAGAGAKKLITLMTSDRRMGNVRSSTDVRVLGSYRSISISVDAQPTLVDDERLKLDLGLDYQPEPPTPTEREGAPPLSHITERFGGLILHSGKPMIISQAADPTSERKVTVEVTATILK